MGEDSGTHALPLAAATLLAALLAVATLAILSFQGRKRRLPPGSRGFPFVGETLRMISSYKTDNPEPFVDDRIGRHGRVFTTHLFGETTVFSADPDLNRKILQGEGRVVESSYPGSITTLLGRHSLVVSKGALHKRLHSLVLGAFANASILRDHHLPDIDRLVRQNLDLWTSGEVLHLLEQAKKTTFELAVKQLMSCEPGPWTDELRQHYHIVINGFFSLPVALPFTAYRRAIKARKKISVLLGPVVRHRMEGLLKRSKEVDHSKVCRVGDGKDMLDVLLEDVAVKEEEVVEFLLSLLVAGYETTPTVITIAVKYLSEFPHALARLKEEHDAISASKSRLDPLEWTDYKSSMPFTQCVINEVLRLSSIVSGVFRRTMKDIDLKGYVVPKGCKIFSSFRAVHLDPIYYEDARTFNPWRWEQKPDEATTPKHQANIFTPFGGGQRLCPGYELARLEISVFLHYLVTTFSWEPTEMDSIVHFPTTRVVKGYPIRVHRLVDTSGEQDNANAI